MLKTLDETIALINKKKLLHISATQDLLRKLPKGNWIGGSAECFATDLKTDNAKDKLWVFEMDFETYNIKTYTTNTISMFTSDTYPNGFSIIIMPGKTKLVQSFAKNAPHYKDIFLKSVVGWVAGSENDEAPFVVNGQTGELLTNEAVILNVALPDDKIAVVNVVNIFTANESSPVIEFETEAFQAKNCLIDGADEILTDYAESHHINLQFPLIGEYYGSEVNTTMTDISDDKVVDVAAPLFKGIKYRFSKPLDNYADAFVNKINNIKDKDCIFSCNCISNKFFGKLDEYDLGGFYGPYVYGEIAYQLMNQTLVYLQIK